jgi:LAO/AO transport system kinase
MTAADGGRHADLVERLLDGDYRALARTITVIEDRQPGYRDLVAALYAHRGDAHVVGVTGSPGAGKSTLVDKLAAAYRDRGLTVGVVAVDPSSPYSGGAVLGDRVRMGSTVGDMDVFVRSMSTRGQLGGLSTATADAIVALEAFGKDRIVVETVGAGQNEVDVVRAADTVAVLVQPGSGDDVQMLKAGILEIGDLFVVNKADLEGAGRTVADLEEMVAEAADGDGRSASAGHHGPAAGAGESGHGHAGDPGHGGDTRHGRDQTDDHGGDGNGPERGRDAATQGTTGGAGGGQTDAWTPPVLETVATTGEGVGDLVAALSSHRDHARRTGAAADRERTRHAATIRRLLRSDLTGVLDGELDRRGGVEAMAAAVVNRETDPYTLADEVLAPVRECLDRLESGESGDGAGSEPKSGSSGSP